MMSSGEERCCSTSSFAGTTFVIAALALLRRPEALKMLSG